MIFKFYFYLINLKINKMKIVNVIAMSIIGSALASFSLKSNGEEKKHQNSYVLDQEHSSLSWKGGKNDAYFHVGKVKISEGNIVMEHGELVSGKFMIDLSTIECTDVQLPKQKQEGLAKHLKGDDFFNIAKFAAATVTIGNYKDGKLTTIINVLGVDIKQDIPVAFVANEKGASIVGKFDIDFTAANILGVQPQEGDKESIKPIFSFDLNAVLKTKK
jgi:polyisoprenoid-binding protein YceI